MVSVNWADANKLHCPHEPPHETWVSDSGREYAVCRMADRHLFNTIAMLQRMEVDLFKFDDDDVEYWLDVFDRELNRRYKNKVQEAYDELERLKSLPSRPLQGK